MLAVSVLVVSLLAASPAAAVSAPPIVRVYVAGSEEALSGSRDTIQDLCSRSNVAVVVRDAAGADEALLGQSPAPSLAEAYVDLRPGSAPRVVVIDGETRKDLERRTLPKGASLEVSIETMAQVVCAAVTSSLATREAVPRVTQEPPEKAESRAIEQSGQWPSQLSLFVAAANFGAGFQPGAGASFGFSHGHGPLRLGALVNVAGYPARDVESAGGVASFSLLGVRLLPTLEWHATQGMTVFVGLGGGADWIRVAAERPPPGTVGQAAGNSVDAIASAILGVRLHLGSRVAALLALDADVDLWRHRYVIQTPQGSQSFFETSHVCPVALAGLSVALAAGSGSAPLNGARE